VLWQSMSPSATILRLDGNNVAGVLGMKVGSHEAIGVSRKSSRQIAQLGQAFADQVTLAQGGNTRELNVALVLTPTELVVTGASLRRISLQDVATLQGDLIVLRDGTRIPWTPFRGDRERTQMFEAIARVSGVEYSPTPVGGAHQPAIDGGAAGNSDTQRLIAAINELEREAKSQSDELASIRNVVIVICLIMVFLVAALVFGWIKIYPVQ
jgi:hypothetical protein